MALKDLIIKGEEGKLFAALLRLRKAGWSVAPGDKPGLTYVGGRQLTVPQIYNLVANLK